MDGDAAGDLAGPTDAELAIAPFSLPTLTGGTVDLAERLGKQPIVLVFWPSWCAPCVAEAPHLVRLHQTYGPQGVAFVSVSEDTADQHGKLRALVKRLGIAYPVALDADGSVLGSVRPGGAVPLTLVLDATGATTYMSDNYEPGDEVALEAAITAVVGTGEGGH